MYYNLLHYISHEEISILAMSRNVKLVWIGFIISYLNYA